MRGGLALGAATGGVALGHAMASCGALAATVLSAVVSAAYPDLQNVSPPKEHIEIGYTNSTPMRSKGARLR